MEQTVKERKEKERIIVEIIGLVNKERSKWLSARIQETDDTMSSVIKNNDLKEILEIISCYSPLEQESTQIRDARVMMKLANCNTTDLEYMADLIGRQIREKKSFIKRTRFFNTVSLLVLCILFAYGSDYLFRALALAALLIGALTSSFFSRRSSKALSEWNSIISLIKRVIVSKKEAITLH